MGRKSVRKWITVAVAIVMAFSLAGCDSLESGNTDMPSVPSSSENVTETDNILIAYFTWAENATDTSGVDATTSASVQVPGNVAQMAAWIGQETGGDLFSIRVEEPYSADYDECLDRAADEKAENVRPDCEIETNVLGVYRDDIPKCQEAINNWLEEIGY